MAHHALSTAIGTVLSQTGDWFGGRSKRQKENVDSSASGSNSAAEAGSNSEVGYSEMAITVLLKLAITVISLTRRKRVKKIVI